MRVPTTGRKLSRLSDLSSGRLVTVWATGVPEFPASLAERRKGGQAERRSSSGIASRAVNIEPILLPRGRSCATSGPETLAWYLMSAPVPAPSAAAAASAIAAGNPSALYVILRAGLIAGACDITAA